MLLHALKPSLNGGEIDPALWYRTDLAKFSAWLKKDVNFLPNVQGGVSNRPGTEFKARAKAENVRLIPFQFSGDANNAYILEFGPGYIRFLTPAGPVLDAGGNPYEVATPFTAANLPKICKWQIGDVMYIAWGGKPKTLTRYAHADWRLADYKHDNGPYDAQNADDGRHVSVGYDTARELFAAYADAAIFVLKDAGRMFRVKNTFNAVHLKSTVSASAMYDSGHFFVSGAYTFQTQGTWSGKAKIEYSKDLANWKTEREFVSLNNKNFNFDGEMEEGLWWARITADVSGGELTLSFDTQSFEGKLNFEIVSRVSPSKVFMKSLDGLVNLEELLENSGELTYNLIPAMTSNTQPAGEVYSAQFGADAWQLFAGGARGLGAGAEYGLGYRFAAKQYVKSVRLHAGWRRILGEELYPGSLESFFSKFNLFYAEGGGEKKKISYSAYLSDKGEITFDFGRYVLLDDLYMEFAAVKKGDDTPLIGSITAAGYAYDPTHRPQMLQTDFAFGLWGDGAEYPTGVKAHQQRLVWLTGRRADMTKTGNFKDFGVSAPMTDDDAISLEFADDQIRRITAAAAAAKLVLFTAASNHVHNQDKLTPSTAAFTADFGDGAGAVDPVRTRGSILYVSSLREYVSDFAYDYQRDGYAGNDLTLFAKHLFRNKKIKEMAWQKEPDGRLWVVQDTGELLCLTYLPEQDVMAWCRVETDGQVLSATVLSDGEHENVYLAVMRKNGTFIEKMVTRMLSVDPKEQFYVDCGATYRGEPAWEISGLDWLEGCEAAILADGNEVPRQVVKNGRVTLPYAAGVVHVGLPYAAELETLSGELGLGDGTSADRKKRIIGADVFFTDSRGGEMGTSGGQLDPIFNEVEKYNAAAPLLTRTARQNLPGNNDRAPGLVIRQACPLPMTVAGFVLRVATGG